VRGENRRDFRRVMTVAMALVTAALCYFHVTGRDRTEEEARREVLKMHAAATAAIEQEMADLRVRLATWKGGDDLPAPFLRVEDFGPRPTTGMRQVARPGPDGRVRPYWVFTDAADTLAEQEGEATLAAGAEYAFPLQFRGVGRARLSLWAVHADEGAGPVEIALLHRRGSLPPDPLGGGGVLRAEGRESAPGADPRARAPDREVSLALDDASLRERHEIVLRLPPDAPPVTVHWRAALGESGGREIALGILVADTAAAAAGAPERTAFVVGHVGLDHFRKRLLDLRFLDTETWGDRLYLTDVSGTVVEAIPGFPEKIRDRVKLEGRTSLASAATQRIKIRNAGQLTYEGFARDRVYGAFAPLEAIRGGVVVEREEKRVLQHYRGVQAWHGAALVFALLVLFPAIPPLVRRIKEDTELPRILAMARGFLPHVILIVACATLYSVGQGIFAYQGKVVTDEILLEADSVAYGRLRGVCWLLAWVSLGMFVVNWAKEYLGKVILHRMIMEIRCMLCEKIAHLPMAFHSRQRAGELLSRIQNDVNETNRGLEMLFGDVIADPILILTLTVSAFVINWRLALVIFVGLPVLLIPISYFGKVIKKSARKRQARKADVTQAVNQMLSGIRVVKAFRMEDHEGRRIRAVSGRFLAEALSVARAQVTSKELLELFQNISIALVTGLGGYFVLERQVSIGDLTAFGVLIGRMYRSSKSLTSNYNRMQESLAGTERIFEIVDTPDTLADRPGARALVRPRSEVSFENVSFRYNDDGPWVLRNISFRVPVGTSVALVGATGAGKSTILDLVARFYDPQEGRIAVDGVDLRDYSRDSLLSHVAIVTQEPFLFNATIRENLLYGKTGAAATEVEAAARAAFIHDEILKQAEGYETIVGERGSRLSGGQRQRPTIARAILKDPPVLLLDEATSALDSRAEQKVQEALSNLMRDRTTFVIAHRLSTIQGVDRILVLENGAIVEQGTHRELLDLPHGHYRRLYDIQFASALQGRPEPPAGAAGIAG
jgi:subfamily B ATP-binding cassette protein MsbA